MKTLLLYMICAILTITISCNKQAHNNASEEQGESMLLEFYSKHFDIWKNTNPNTKVPVTARKEKLDSLMQIYCTSEVKNEAIQAFENAGVDWITQNYLGDINENLKVEKVAGKENSYTVSFTSTILEIPTKPLKQNVTLHLSLVKEKGSYKIASISNPVVNKL